MCETATIGKPAPVFAVKAYHDDKFMDVSLDDYRGKWVILFFYPADFTFVCPTELSELADNYAELQKLGAEVLSISTDTEFVHKAWHDHSPAIKKIQFPMLADPKREVAKSYNVYIAEEGLALRGTFIIDPDGVLQAMEVNSNNIGRSATELVRKVQAAKFVAEHKGQVCPASWKPGGKTLTPGIDLVGKI
ncbi:peroxiredoxin [Candidatus Woesearchaeota archaeon CG1_02_57_44]|nr:MAG: peroxiredoxin [Candidatus Woesearchaeota archaeon CG1_02_57_44]PIN67790.1 MAG: peroxiredoxin [Candidatus Woesearchaeota archaeon CG11_big_fil_rev_8_21_14_0_20_57_5]